MPPRKKNRTRRPSAKARNRRQVRILLGVAVLFAFLVASLVLLSQVRRSYQPVTLPPPPPTKPAPTAAEFRERLRSEMEGFFWRAGIGRDQVRQHEEGGTAVFEVDGSYPPATVVEEFRGQLAPLAASVALREDATEARIDLWVDDRLGYRLQFQRPPAAAARGRVSIIMDDMGRDLASARRLLAIELPVALAVLPGEPHAREVAELAHRRGREVLLHIPMEPQSYPVTDPGKDALFLQYSREEIRQRFRGYLRRVPYAVGGNNHMGSRFTESREGMAAVIEIMKESKLFFVDSVTTGHSLAFREARRQGVPAAARDIFLDNAADVPKIRAQIEQLAELALRQGQAVAICHPYPETLTALEESTSLLADLGVVVVPVAELLAR